MRDPKLDEYCSRVDDEVRLTETRWPTGLSLIFIFVSCLAAWVGILSFI